GEETLQKVAILAGEDGDVGAAANAGAANDIVVAVAVRIAGGYAHAAGETRIEGEKVEEHRAVLAAEDDDVRSAARVGADDDIAHAVVVDPGAGDKNAAGEVRVKCPEPAQKLLRGAVKHFDIGAAPRARTGDDVVHAVAVQIGQGDADAAREIGVIGLDG